MAILDTEPTRITAGDSLQWTRDAGNYPSSAGWTLNYAFQGPSQITFAATPNGTGWSVAVAAAVTAPWPPGSYAWAAFVVNADGARRTIGRGTLAILANPAAAYAEHHCERMLQLINCALEQRIPRGLEHTDIDGQTLSRIPLVDLYSLKQKYLQEVYDLRLARRAASGIKTSRTIGIRFVNPRAPGFVPHAD